MQRFDLLGPLCSSLLICIPPCTLFTRVTASFLIACALVGLPTCNMSAKARDIVPTFDFLIPACMAD